MEINLLEHQKEHINNIENVFRSGLQFYIDCSVMGSGKTYTTLYMAKRYNLPIFVVCPKSVVEKWRECAINYNIPIIDIMTYQTIRGRSEVINHDYLTTLTTYKEINHKNVKVKKYFITERFKEIVKQGVMLIFDEVQNCKNNSDQANSCSKLSFEIMNTSENNSKLVLLSATPFDKIECTQNLFKMLGFYDEELYTADAFGRNFVLTGYYAIIEQCMKINKNKTQEIMNKQRSYLCFYRAKYIVKSLYHVFTSIIKPAVVFVMPEIKNEFNHNIVNLFCKADDDKITNQFKEQIENLRKACKMNNNGIIKEKRDFGQITIFLRIIEIMKTIYYVKNLIVNTLESEENRKVIFYFNYYATADLILNDPMFEKYNPVFMNGSLNVHERQLIMNKFQKENLDCRLFLGITKVGGIGIDLDDKFGNFPRTLFIIPNYTIIDLHQATGRIDRSETKSNTETYFVYSEELEVAIMTALARKSKVLSDISKNSKSKIKFPGEYPGRYNLFQFLDFIDIPKLI